jgi:hypothetical protein
MPSFNGQQIFGFAVKMDTSDNPRANQLNAFAGLSGVESLDLGFRGRYTTVNGLLFGTNVSNLAVAVALFRSYNDGLAYVLVDTLGVSWANVKLDTFQPSDRGMTMFGIGCFKKYSARFIHLT